MPRGWFRRKKKSMFENDEFAKAVNHLFPVGRTQFFKCTECDKHVLKKCNVCEKMVCECQRIGDTCKSCLGKIRRGTI
jgi:hypothetical protein